MIDAPDEELNAFIHAYMVACKGRAPDHNEVGYEYFRAAWIARAQFKAAEEAKCARS